MKRIESIVQEERECFVCGSVQDLERHHCIGGNPGRKLSEKYGLTVYLCAEHHRGDGGVHGGDGGELNDRIKRTAQKAFEEVRSREEFMGVFGRNYIDG